MDRNRTHSPEEHARLGAFLKSIRQRLGITQAKIGEVMEQPQSNISRIESGERQLLVLELMDYAKALGMKPEDLIAEFRKSLK